MAKEKLLNKLIGAVVSGFGFSLGTVLFKKASKKLGFDERGERIQADPEVVDGEEDGEAEPA